MQKKAKNVFLAGYLVLGLNSAALSDGSAEIDLWIQKTDMQIGRAHV